MTGVKLSPLDEVRRKLRLKEQELAKTQRELKTARESMMSLRNRIDKLESGQRKAQSALQESSEESSWKLYNAPGVCGICGSLTCSGTCFK